MKSKKAKHKSSSEETKPAAPAKVEKVNKALLALQKEEEKEKAKAEKEEKLRGENNPWKDAPKPLSSVIKNKKKSKHGELLSELASTSVIQKVAATHTLVGVSVTTSTPKKDGDLPIRFITTHSPAAHSAPPALGIPTVPLNAASLALSVGTSDTASSTPSIASSGSPSRSMGVELTEEERKRKDRLKEKKRKQKDAKKKKKADTLAAAKAAERDAEMKDA